VLVPAQSSGEPKLRIIGVYELPEYPDVHLVEVHIDAPPPSVETSGFGQDDPALPVDGGQVAYDERYLDDAGNSFISERWAIGWEPLDAGIVEPQTSRLVFFLHFLSFDRPLQPLPGQSIFQHHPRCLKGLLASSSTSRPIDQVRF